jgi:hypothetical protein
MISVSQCRDPRFYTKSGEPEVQFHHNTTLAAQQENCQGLAGERQFPDWNLLHETLESVRRSRSSEGYIT